MGDGVQAASGKGFTLVKFDKPEQIITRYENRRGGHHQDYHVQGKCFTDEILDESVIERCKEATTSHIETEQILHSIAPPREWEEEGRKYRQQISKVPATRADILDLNDALNEQLTNRQARPDGICPIRRELADQAFDELIRQIAISQPERGLLLLRVRDELRMTLSAYQDLFVSSRDYDPYRHVLKESFTHKEELERKHALLSTTLQELQEERDNLTKLLDCDNNSFKEQREAAHKKHVEEFQFLKRVNNVLKQHMEAMMDPMNNIDPIIAAFGTGPKDKKIRQRKRRHDICK